MSLSVKVDAPPLLTPGFHTMDLERLHMVAVECPRFKLSSTRAQIMRNLWTVVGCLAQWGIWGELWIDGSFLTQKINPSDVDIILVLPERFLDTATPEQLSILDWWEHRDCQPKTLFSCDTYTNPKAEASHPDYSEYRRMETYWTKWFGISRQDEPKGIVRMLLAQGDSA